MVGLSGYQGVQSNHLLSRQSRSYISPQGTGALEGSGISPDGSLLFSGNGFGVHVWNAASGELIAILPGVQTYGNISVSTDQRLVTISSYASLLGLWGIRTEQ